MSGTTARILFEAWQYPVLQNTMYATPDAARACPKGDIRLVEDPSTGLVYNGAFQPELVRYDTSYQNEQACSPFFAQHLAEVLEVVEREIGRRRVIEVGCGKGHFFESLQARGFDVTGFDPTYEGSNPGILKRNFDAGAGIKADALVLRHVLEHIPHPYEFLSMLRESNGGRGSIYIEVPCLEWICRRKAWFDVFYEHVNYFRPGDFRRMFSSIRAGGHLFGGQYLYVVADLETLRQPVLDAAERVDFPADFSPLDIGGQPRAAATPGSVAVWGGASKGVIFCLMRERHGTPVDFVIDINPGKQGKYLPATGLLVQSPQEVLAHLPAGSTIYIMNSNYAQEIRQMAGNAYAYVEVDSAR